MLNAKKGLSACQAARDIGLRRPTVWSMMHRIRKTMGSDEAQLLSGIIEMDETYVGGKPHKDSKDKDDDGNYPTNKRGRGTKKGCVVGMIIQHLQVNHQKEFSRDDVKHGKIYTNTIEGFWALLKRVIIDRFHKVSAKYLYKYI